MQRTPRSRARLGAYALFTGALVLAAAAHGREAYAPTTTAAPAPPGGTELERRLEALAEENRELRSTLEALRDEVRAVRDEAAAAREAAARNAAGTSAQPTGPRFQLLDISADVITGAAVSGAGDGAFGLLQGGAHDPVQRGFSIPQVELALRGAVDPFFTGEVFLVGSLDEEGETVLELEEAVARSTALPFGLEQHGLQLEVGQMFTEFGRLNPRHPHSWLFADQPVVLTRFFGGDGLRNPGVRLGWLLPLPFYAELHLGAQTARGETAVSFLANEEVFEERPIGGRPFREVDPSNANRILYLGRLVAGGDLSDTWSAQAGLSALRGPNATGPDGRTLIVGADFVAKWRPLRTDKGWPFVIIEGEVLRRSYRADAFRGCPEAALEEPCEAVFLPEDELRDWGAYLQGVWGFRRGFAAGLRAEWAGGSGASLGPYAGRASDPFRSSRLRLTPLFIVQPTEYTRLRLQYAYDRTGRWLPGHDAHTLLATLEISLGSHAAHSY